MTELAIKLLLEKLSELELQLHQPEVRQDAKRLSRLLDQEFYEIGRSGQVYHKEEVIKALVAEPTARIYAKQFELQLLQSELILLTYISHQLSHDGVAYCWARRSSIWHYNNNHWRLRFHQATAMDDKRRSN